MSMLPRVVRMTVDEQSLLVTDQDLRRWQVHAFHFLPFLQHNLP